MFEGYATAEFERWLRIGLEKYCFEDAGAWAFPKAERYIVRQEFLALGLRDAYSEMKAAERGAFRQAVANVLASLEPQERFVPLFEHLLILAGELPVPEVLHVLPRRVGNGFFGLTRNREGESLFVQTMFTVAQLAAPRPEVVACLHSLIGSRNYFDPAYAGVALLALCRAVPDDLVDHLRRLRASLSVMFNEFTTSAADQQQLAQSVLHTMSLNQIVAALPQLKYFDPFNENAALDTWLLIGLTGGNRAPLVAVLEEEEGKLSFKRRGNGTVSESLRYDTDFMDLIEALRENRLLTLEPIESRILERHSVPEWFKKAA